MKENDLVQCISDTLLHFGRPDLIKFKDVYTLKNPKSTPEDIEQAINKLEKAIESEIVDFPDMISCIQEYVKVAGDDIEIHVCAVCNEFRLGPKSTRAMNIKDKLLHVLELTIDELEKFNSLPPKVQNLWIITELKDDATSDVKFYHLNPLHINKSDGSFHACTTCHRSLFKGKVPKMSIAAVDFGHPLELFKNITKMEVNMISRVRIISQIYQLKTGAGALGYKYLTGHVLHFKHDASDISAAHIKSLPHKDAEKYMHLTYIGTVDNQKEIFASEFMRFSSLNRFYINLLFIHRVRQGITRSFSCKICCYKGNVRVS
jgi:hypothetical protein